MRFIDKEVTSISDLVEGLADPTIQNETVWFRGQSDKDWHLIPSLARQPNGVEAEIALLKRFKQNALPLSKTRPATEWEWMFLMQHHGVPTRLLDWTESPLIGLYFAVTENLDKDGALWCLNPTKLNENANVTYGFTTEIPCFDHDEILDGYLPTRIASERRTNLNPLAAMAIRDNPRVFAQLGNFTITHRTQTTINSVGNSSHIWRFIVPSIMKETISHQLSSIRITKLTLFPELDNVALVAKEILR